MTRDSQKYTSHADVNRLHNRSDWKPGLKVTVITLFLARAVTLGSCVSIQ